MRHPLTVEAAVILPDHLHAISTLPADDADFARRWGLIQSAFSRCLPTGERICASRANKNERGIWQPRYWEHTLQDEDDFARHLDYIHFNPVKHGHAARVRDWPIPRFAAGQARRLFGRLGRRRPHSSNLRYTAVDEEFDAADIGAVVGGEEHCRLAEIVRCP